MPRQFQMCVCPSQFSHSSAPSGFLWPQVMQENSLGLISSPMPSAQEAPCCKGGGREIEILEHSACRKIRMLIKQINIPI